MSPVLQPLVRYAADLERAAADHPDQAGRLMAEAADVWMCLGRRDLAVAALAVLVVRRRRASRRPPPLACQRSAPAHTVAG